MTARELEETESARIEARPTDGWCSKCGRQAADLDADERCLACRAWTVPGTVRVLATDLAAQTRELEHLRAQVTELQAANTRLVEERRAADWVAHLRHMFVLFEQAQPERPGWPDAGTLALRRRLIREEFQETIDALDDGDLVEFADGCIDACVVALGSLIACGIDPRAIWDEVYRTNAAKCVEGKLVRSAEGKVMKPPGWTPPDIAGLLREQGWRP